MQVKCQSRKMEKWAGIDTDMELWWPAASLKSRQRILGRSFGRFPFACPLFVPHHQQIVNNTWHSLRTDSRPFWPRSLWTFLRNYIFFFGHGDKQWRTRGKNKTRPGSPSKPNLPSRHWSRCQRQSAEADKPQRNTKQKKRKEKKKFRNLT